MYPLPRCWGKLREDQSYEQEVKTGREVSHTKQREVAYPSLALGYRVRQAPLQGRRPEGIVSCILPVQQPLQWGQKALGSQPPQATAKTLTANLWLL